MTPVATGRGSAAGGFALRLGGVDVGRLTSADGGAISAPVIVETTGDGPFARKHIGPPVYEPLDVQFGLDMNSAVFDWLQATLDKNFIRKNGAVVNHDAAFAVRSIREFDNALITAVTFPAMDGASKDPCALTVKIAPEIVRTKKGSGKVALGAPAAQKKWLPSNFRLEIDGLDCTKVSHIDGFTVTQAASSDSIGDSRDLSRVPGRLEFPNLSITLAETAAASWSDWFEDFVLKGNNDPAHEKKGALIFLSPNRLTELGRVSFTSLGIFRLAPTKVEAGSENIRRITAQLYCERLQLKVVA